MDERPEDGSDFLVTGDKSQLQPKEEEEKEAEPDKEEGTNGSSSGQAIEVCTAIVMFLCCNILSPRWMTTFRRCLPPMVPGSRRGGQRRRGSQPPRRPGLLLPALGCLLLMNNYE